MIFQLGSSLLDACVLAVLHTEDTYGYKLTQKMKDIMNVSESTLYPVLRRLTNEGYLITYDQEHMGRNRRYYRLTEKGKEQYQVFVKEWNMFTVRINQILIGGN